MSRHSRRTRTAIVEQCLVSSKRFMKEFTVRLLQMSKSYGCIGKDMCWIGFSVSVLKCSGACEGMRHAIVKLVEAQSDVLDRMIYMNRLPSSRMYNCVRPVIALHPGLIEIYMSRVQSASSGSPGLVWMLCRAMISLRYNDDKIMGAYISKIFHVFVDKILCGKTKEAPHQGELACFGDVFSYVSQDDFEKIFLPAAVKMAKRSPEISMTIVNAAMSSMRVDFCGCGSELLPLIIQQGKHGKETVRQRAEEMMQVVAKKTKDSSVLISYAEAVKDAFLAKDATKLKTPQEKSSMASILGAVAVFHDENVHLPVQSSMNIAESLCYLVENEASGDTKACLIVCLGQWMEVTGKAPPSFGNVIQLAMKATEQVRRALLEICSELCTRQEIAETVAEYADDFIRYVVDGSQKAAMQLDAIVSLSCLLVIGREVPRVDEMMMKKGVWDILNMNICQYLSLDFLKGLSEHYSKLSLCCAHRLLESSSRISEAQRQGSCNTLTSFALHYDQSVRKAALGHIKAIVKSDLGCEITLALLHSFRSMCNNEKSLEFICSKSNENPICKNFVYERYLGTLLAIVPRHHAQVPISVAVALCVMAHHPKVSSSRGPSSAWATVLSACKSFISSVEADIDGTLRIALGDDWGIESGDNAISESAIMAFVSLGKSCGEKLYEPFMGRIKSILYSDEHESLTAKQLRIYATPFGRLSNESEDGGFIPAELMDEILSDKTSIKSPIFAPSKEQSIKFRDDTLIDIDNSLSKKEDPAAAARKKQLALEAEVRLHVVELRDKLSRWLNVLGNYAKGARMVVSARLSDISSPCMKLLSSPLVGESSALNCLNMIVACIPGIIGRFHSTMCVCFHLIHKEEVRKNPSYDDISGNPYMARGAEVLIEATGGTISTDDSAAMPGTIPLSPQLYSFFFPIINAILRYVLFSSDLERSGGKTHSSIEKHADQAGQPICTRACWRLSSCIQKYQQKICLQKMNSLCFSMCWKSFPL